MSRSRFTPGHSRPITLQHISFTLPCLVVSTIGSLSFKQWQHLPVHLIHGKPPDTLREIKREETVRNRGLIQGVQPWSEIQFLLRIPIINHYELLIANLSLVSNNTITAWQWITHLNYIKVMDLPLCSTSAFRKGWKKKKNEREREREREREQINDAILNTSQ